MGQGQPHALVGESGVEVLPHAPPGGAAVELAAVADVPVVGDEGAGAGGVGGAGRVCGAGGAALRLEARLAHGAVALHRHGAGVVGIATCGVHVQMCYMYTNRQDRTIMIIIETILIIIRRRRSRRRKRRR